MFKQGLAALFFVAAQIALGDQAADLPSGATILDTDIVWDIANPHSFAISTDGERIAYVSKGALWACRVDSGPPQKLAELPNTITAILAAPGNEKQRQQSAGLPFSRGYMAFYGPIYSDRDYIFCVAWTPSGDGVVYTIRKRIADGTPRAAYHVMYAPLTGGASTIAVIEGAFDVPQEYDLAIHVTPDRRFVVIGGFSPQIWDARRARPQVTPYDLMVPSETGDRYLGVEIDTRQLVLIDQQFSIVKRFPATFPPDRRVRLEWSDDGRYCVGWTVPSHGDTRSDGFRLDLQSGARDALDTAPTSDAIFFSGRGGEVVAIRSGKGRWGQADIGGGPTFTITPDDADSAVWVWPFSSPDFQLARGVKRFDCAPVVVDKQASLFVMAPPRDVDSGAAYRHYLVDRAGRVEPIIPASARDSNTPWFPITFADQGRLLVARAGATLFSIPVPELGEKHAPEIEAPQGDEADQEQ